MDLAEAALQIAAEDDALVSHSAVQFPVAYERSLLSLPIVTSEFTDSHHMLFF